MGRNGNKGKSVSSSVSKAMVRNMIKSSIMAAAELKRYVVSFTGVATTTAGAVTPITQGIVLGDSLVTRDGDQCIIRKLTIRHQSTLATGSANSLRIIVFWDNQANGSTPSVNNSVTIRFMD